MRARDSIQRESARQGSEGDVLVPRRQGPGDGRAAHDTRCATARPRRPAARGPSGSPARARRRGRPAAAPCAARRAGPSSTRQLPAAWARSAGVYSTWTSFSASAIVAGVTCGPGSRAGPERRGHARRGLGLLRSKGGGGGTGQSRDRGETEGRALQETSAGIGHGCDSPTPSYITAPSVHGANSASPKPRASLFDFSPEATRRMRSKIRRPQASTVSSPSAMPPQSTSMSSLMRR